MSPSSREGDYPHTDLVFGLESWERAKLDQSSRRAVQATARSIDQAQGEGPDEDVADQAG